MKYEIRYTGFGKATEIVLPTDEESVDFMEMLENAEN